MLYYTIYYNYHVYIVSLYRIYIYIHDIPWPLMAGFGSMACTEWRPRKATRSRAEHRPKAAFCFGRCLVPFADIERDIIWHDIYLWHFGKYIIYEIVYYIVHYSTLWHDMTWYCMTFGSENMFSPQQSVRLWLCRSPVQQSIPCRCRQEKVTTAWRLGTGGTSRAMAELKWSMDVCAKRISFGKVFGAFWYTVTWVSWWCILSSYSNSSSAVNCKSPLDLGGNSKIDSSFKAACREGNGDGGTR